MNKIDPLQVLFYIWVSIAIVTAIVIAYRTITFGWFHGKDDILWAMLAMSIFFAWRRRISK